MRAPPLSDALRVRVEASTESGAVRRGGATASGWEAGAKRERSLSEAASVWPVSGMPRSLRPSATVAELAVIRNETFSGRQHGFDHRMPPANDLKADIVADLRTAAGPAGRQRRGCQRDIDRGNGLCRR